jgi:hypothetical protein
MNILNTSKKQYFDTVKTCSVQVWIDAVNDGNLKALRIGKRGNNKTDAEAYERLMDDYLSEFGISNELIKIIKKRQQLGRVLIEYLYDVETNRQLLNDINILRVELENLNKQGGDSLIKVIAILVRQGINIDLQKDTIYKVEHIIRSLKNGN